MHPMACIRRLETADKKKTEDLFEVHLLPGLVAQTAPFSLFLTTTENISHEALTTEEWLRFYIEAGNLDRPVEACFYQWPTSPYPVAVTTIDKLVGSP